jgi:hypothetical protein
MKRVQDTEGRTELASIALCFYKPNLAMNAYILLVLFHFLPGKTMNLRRSNIRLGQF